MLLAFTVFFACNRNEPTEQGPSGTPAGEATSTPGGTAAPAETADPTKNPLPTSVDVQEPGNEPVPTLMEDTGHGTEDGKDSEVSVEDPGKPGTDGKSEEEGRQDKPESSGTPEKDPAADEMRARRNTDWNDTFLSRIPEFTYGMYSGYTAEETFDRAAFAGTKMSEVREYIAALTEAGFVNNVEAAEHESSIIFTASDANNWIVELEYSEGLLSVGSGYRSEDRSSGEYVSNVWLTTLLSNLPVFEAGNFGSDAAGSDGSHNIVYENVTDEDIRLYIEAVKEAGFTLDPDEGDSDGFIWYMAENEHETLCSITFYDGVVRISAGPGSN